MKAITQSWLNYAKIDLQSCKKLLEDEFLTNSVAFHAQQVIEKCFKAMYEDNSLKVPRIHSLLRLYDGISEYIVFKVDESMLERTDAVYTETRYPSDLGLLPEGKPSIENAKKLYEFAEYIYQNTIEQITKKE